MSRPRTDRKRKAVSENSVQSLEQRTLLCGTNPTFAHPGQTPIERIERTALEAVIQSPAPEIAFQRLDENSDGQLTTSELTEQTWSRLAAADTDNDCALTLPELQSTRRNTELDLRRPAPEIAFGFLDRNVDARLTAGEVSPALWSVLSRVDRNKDGSVTIPELLSAREELEDRIRRPDPASVFAELDVNADDQLTADEVSEPIWRLLSRADANEDGGVTVPELQTFREELEDFVRRPNPASVFERLDVNNDLKLTPDEVSEPLWRLLSKADGNNDGAVTLLELVVLRQRWEERVRSAEPGDVFEYLDLNGDGQLTADEISDELWPLLSSADGNGDGGVTFEELRALREQWEDRIRRVGPEDVFTLLDLNADGQLTEDEVSEELWAIVSRADGNNDGGVTPDELRALRRKWEDRIQRPNPGDVFDMLDVSRDTALTDDEVGEVAWRRIARADANGDNAVTLDELRAAHEDSRRQLTWAKDLNAASYEVWINDAANKAVMRQDGLTSTAFSILHLDDGDYFLWLQDENDAGGGPWRRRTAFTVLNGAVAVESSPGTIERDGTDGAHSWEIWINSAATKSRVHRAAGLTTADYALPQLPDGAYYYWTQAEDENGQGPWSKRLSLTIQDGAVVQESSPGTISWGHVAGAASYEVWLNNGATNKRVFRQAGITETEFKVPYLPDGSYFWWLQSEADDGRGSWSGRREFTVSDGQIRESPGALTWAIDASAATYEAWVSVAGGNSKPVARAQGLTENSYKLPALADGNYEYWIQSEGADGRGSWSQKLTFSVVSGQLVTSAFQAGSEAAVDGVAAEIAVRGLR